MEVLFVVAVLAGYLLLRRSFRKPAPGRRPASTIAGKAWVTDGDGLPVRGHTIRIAGVDAPEHDQAARHRDGYQFNHGNRVKSALIREIGGRYIRVSVVGVDKYGRPLGSVTCQGRHIGDWLVREGHAIAGYSDRYRHVEQEARKAGRGMWGHARNFDPRAHQRRHKKG